MDTADGSQSSHLRIINPNRRRLSVLLEESGQNARGTGYWGVTNYRENFWGHAPAMRQAAFSRGVEDGSARAPIEDYWLRDGDHGLARLYLFGYAVGLYRKGER